MGDPGPVHRQEAVHQLLDPLLGFFPRGRRGGSQALAKSLPLEKLHGQEAGRLSPFAPPGFLRVFEEEIEDTADIGVGNLPGELDLLAEEGHGPGVASDLRTDHFESHPGGELLVEGLEDLPHPSLAHESDDTEPLRRPFSRKEGRNRRAAGA